MWETRPVTTLDLKSADPGHPGLPGVVLSALRARKSVATPPVLGRIGTLEVRLAASSAEIRAAKALRYRVFYEEMNARPSLIQKIRRLDEDRFDAHCDHILAFDRSIEGSSIQQIVGTYRVMQASGAAKAGGFYSAEEFEIDTLLERQRGRRFLELGRSCVLKPYRGKRTAELLWQGIWAYVVANRLDVLFGCASLPGTDPVRLAPILSTLRTASVAPMEWQVRARPERRAPDAVCDAPTDARQALAAMPPLLKGYLRIGAFLGDGAVVDDHFGTTDVLVVLPVERIAPRYIEHYGADAGRFAA